MTFEHNTRKKVMILRTCSEASEKDLYSSLRRAISTSIDLTALKHAEKVIMKVNICKPFPADSGATVDIRVTESVVKLILEWNPKAKVYIVESDASSRSGEQACEETGYFSMQNRFEHLRVVNLSKTTQVTLMPSDKRRFRYFKKGLSLSSLFLDCDFFISISKLKTHEFERYSGILKNQFGCLSTKSKERYHPYLSEVLSDINSVLRPDLCIIDGLVGMEGRGPGFGDPKKMDVLIVGDDPVAVDSVAASIMGLDPLSVPHLKSSAKNGVGESDLGKISLIGEEISTVRSEFKVVPERVLFFFRLSFKVRRLATFFTNIGSSIVMIGRQLERLGGALYIRNFDEIIGKNILSPMARRLSFPRFLFKPLLSSYLTLHPLLQNRRHNYSTNAETSAATSK